MYFRILEYVRVLKNLRSFFCQRSVKQVCGSVNLVPLTSISIIGDSYSLNDNLVGLSALPAIPVPLINFNSVKAKLFSDFSCAFIVPVWIIDVDGLETHHLLAG